MKIPSMTTNISAMERLLTKSCDDGGPDHPVIGPLDTPVNDEEHHQHQLNQYIHEPDQPLTQHQDHFHQFSSQNAWGAIPTDAY